MTRWRIEIRGRAGWFVPAFEAALPDGLDSVEVRHRMVAGMESAGGSRYVADNELGETYHVAELTDAPVCTLPKRRR